MKKSGYSQDTHSNSFDTRPNLLYGSIFFFTMISRLIFSPLLVSLERDLHLTHPQAASIFLFISLGYSLMLFTSGFVAERLHHRGCILLSINCVGLSMLLISFSTSIPVIRIGMVFLGMSAGLYTASGVASLVESAPSPASWEGNCLARSSAGSRFDCCTTSGSVFSSLQLVADFVVVYFWSLFCGRCLICLF